MENFSFSILPNIIGCRVLVFVLWAFLLATMGLHANHPLLAGIAFLCFLVGTVPGTRWNRCTEKVYDLNLFRRTSTNLIATLKPEKTKGRLVLVAHHDSKSQSFPLFMRLILYAVFYMGFLTISLLYLAFLLMGTTDWMLYLWFPTFLLAIPVFLIATNVSHNYSPGGIDNASGLSLLVELARNLKGRVTEIELVFLMTGAEEEGLAGAVRFIQGKEREYSPHDTFFVNLDGIGVPGGLVLLSRHGVPPVRTAGRLEVVMKQIAKDIGLSLRLGYLPVGMGVDHLPIAHKGFRAATLTSSDTGQATLFIHTPRDKAENVDSRLLGECYEFLFRLIRKLDSGATG